jgi:hypothetical protein
MHYQLMTFSTSRVKCATLRYPRCGKHTSCPVPASGTDAAHKILRWLVRTPVQTFVLCPLAVITFELALRRGQIVFVRWRCVLLVWRLSAVPFSRRRSPGALPIEGPSWIAVGGLTLYILLFPDAALSPQEALGKRGGDRGMEVPAARIITSGPYRYIRDRCVSATSFSRPARAHFLVMVRAHIALHSPEAFAGCKFMK